MKIQLVFLLLVTTITIPSLAQDGVITNILVSQRTDGSGIVDIYYNLSGTAPVYFISVEVSLNNGASFSPIPSSSLNGNNNISPGSDKHITWNAASSINNTYSPLTKVKLIASTTVPCGQPITDARDGKTYNTVQIGTQCWMKENLNVGTSIYLTQSQTDNQVIEKYCYFDQESNCDTYGGLYQWDEAMQYVSIDGVQGICPLGWHFPTDAEWCTLIQFIDPTFNCSTNGNSGTDAGGKMKETGTSHWLTPNTGATNSSGFTALPGGRCRYNQFFNLTTAAYFWSSSESTTWWAWYISLFSFEADVYHSNTSKYNGYSVRCVKGEATPAVSTTPVTNITQISATAGGNVISDGGAIVTAKGVCWNTSPNPTIANSHTSDGSGTGVFTSNIIGLNANTTYYIRAYATNSKATSYGGEFSFHTLWGSCPAFPTVTYANKVYNTVQIGTQCWIRENLNVGTRINSSQSQMDNGLIEKYCYDDLESNCDIHGGLYQWDEAMQYLITPGVQGICPTGWHLPTDAELCTLTQYIDPTSDCANVGWSGGSDAGLKMKSINGWFNNGNGTNSSGFTALPSGYFDYNGTFGGLTFGTYFWSSSLQSPAYPWYRCLFFDHADVGRYFNQKTFGFSLRCILGPGSTTTPTVTTTPVSNINQNSATSGGNITNDGGSTVTSRGVCWSTSPNPTIANSHTSDGSGTGVFTSNITGLIANTTYYVCAYATNSVGTAYGNEISFSTLCGSQGIPCPGLPTITDPRNNKIYNTVQIGTQCWLKENLNIGTMIPGDQYQNNNGMIEKYCYGNLESNCDVYGGLYLWEETMQFINTEGAQGICPDGWHVPSDAEWSILTTHLGGESVAGGKMKECGYGHWQSPNTGASNEVGFYALPGGQSDLFSMVFTGMGQMAFLWSSSEESGNPWNAWFLSPVYNSTDVNRLNSSKYIGNSVRCLKGEAIPTVSTSSVSNISQTTATSGGNITQNGGAPVTARGVCWGTSPNPSIANSHTTDGTGSGSFVSSLAGLTPVTLYYVRAYATNIAGTAYGNQVCFITSSGLPCGSSVTINHVAGNVAPVTKTVAYGITTNIPGEPSKCWTTSNLGADHQATSVDDPTEASAGWYWQFNRKQGYKHDGTIRTPNTTWITSINENLDWQPVNDPCVLELGNGWRIPTKSEWENVVMMGNWTNWNDPWNSDLKLHAAGYLSQDDGSLWTRGSDGQYQSTTQFNAEISKFLYINSSYTSFESALKSYAFSIRCLRD